MKLSVNSAQSTIFRTEYKIQDCIILNDTSASKSGSLDFLLQPLAYITYIVGAVFGAEKAAHTIASLLTLNRRRHASAELRVCACENGTFLNIYKQQFTLQAEAEATIKTD